MSTVHATTEQLVLSHDAQIFHTNGRHSIYEGTRMSGEQIRRHILPINVSAEALGAHSNDEDDEELYVRSLMGLLGDANSSRL